MEQTRLEERYLLTILKAVIREKKIPVIARYLNWEDIFRIADYHNVANVVYYGLLGYEGRIPSQWRERFSDKYRDSVLKADRLERAAVQISDLLEDMKIHHMMLNGPIINSCYKFREMRYWDSIDVLVMQGAIQKIHRRLSDMDFEEMKNVSGSGHIYYHVPGIYVRFHEGLSYTGRRMKRYFRGMLSSTRLERGKVYTHTFSTDEYYIYLLCSLIDKYATSNIELRDMLDLWVYEKEYYKALDWVQIDKILKRLGADDFGQKLEQMTYLWFDGGVPDDMEIYSAMEAFILSKGADGRQISAKLFPLVKQVEDFYNRNRRKEWRRKMIRWMFPDREYMQGLYPILEKYRFLLPLCWLHRMIRAGVNLVKNSFRQWRKNTLYPLVKSRLTWIKGQLRAAVHWCVHWFHRHPRS